MRSLFLSPHCDDEVLFGAFTLLKHKPRVIICFPSGGDYGTTEERMAESAVAAEILGVPVEHRDFAVPLADSLHIYDVQCAPDVVWAPSHRCSHKEHAAVGRAARAVFGNRVRHYETYSHLGGETPFRVAGAFKAPIDSLDWIGLKLMALAAFRTQFTHPRAHQFFLQDLHEYAEQP